MRESEVSLPIIHSRFYRRFKIQRKCDSLFAFLTPFFPVEVSTKRQMNRNFTRGAFTNCVKTNMRMARITRENVTSPSCGVNRNVIGDRSICFLRGHANTQHPIIFRLVHFGGHFTRIAFSLPPVPHAIPGQYKSPRDNWKRLTNIFRTFFLISG